MGIRLLLSSIFIITVSTWSYCQSGTITSISDPSATVTYSGNVITIETCEPVTFDVEGMVSAALSGSNLHSVILNSTSGSPSSTDPNFVFHSGPGACNPIVAPPGYYYSAGQPAG